MAGFSGQDGKVLIGSSSIAEITSWSFNTTSSAPSWASSTIPGTKKRVAGVKDGSGSFEGKQDSVTNIEEVIDVGDKPTLLLYEDASRFWSVPSVITSLEIEVDVDDGEPVSFSCDFEVNGPWTKPA